MDWRLCQHLHWAGIRSLMVALAIVGSGLDVVTVPVLTAAGCFMPASEERDASDCEGERDEAPDDLKDLTWPLVQLASRGEKRRHLVNAPECLHASWLRAQGATDLQTTPLFTAIPASVRLCRFTC